MTTYLLSQEGRQCRVHAAWWTPDGEETTGVVLLPDRRTASRLATSLGILSEAVWGQSTASPGDPLPISPAMAELVAGGDGGAEPTRPDDRALPDATRLRVRIADDEAQTIIDLVAGLADETVLRVREEIDSELAAASMSTPSDLDPADRRWQRFRRLDPAAFVALWADAVRPDALFLTWAVGRPVRSVVDGDGGTVTHCVAVGEGIEVRVTPDTIGDDPVLRIDLQCDGTTRAYLDIDDVAEYGHAGALLAEIRSRLTPQYLVDAVVRTEATYRPTPTDDDIATFGAVVRRLIALLPADEPGPT
jgi:hypothetical protein